MIVAVALVCTQVCRRIGQRRLSLADLCWVIFMAGLIAGFVAGHENTADLIGLLAPNLAGPRIAALAWYPWSLLTGVCLGTVCGIVVVLHSLWAIARLMLRAGRLNVRFSRWAPPC
jgi:hypothetical protein